MAETPLTHIFNPNVWEESTLDALYEWLTNDECLGDSPGVTMVVPYLSTSTEKLSAPRCEFGIVNVLNQSTGAGRNKTNAVFRTAIVDITLKASRQDSGGRQAELDLIRKTDTLDKYSRSTKGIPILGQAGFRKVQLAGPFRDLNKYYYQRKYMLSFEVEVA